MLFNNHPKVQRYCATTSGSSLSHLVTFLSTETSHGKSEHSANFYNWEDLFARGNARLIEPCHFGFALCLHLQMTNYGLKIVALQNHTLYFWKGKSCPTFADCEKPTRAVANTHWAESAVCTASVSVENFGRTRGRKTKYEIIIYTWFVIRHGHFCDIEFRSMSCTSCEAKICATELGVHMLIYIYIYTYIYISKYLEKTLFVSIWSISICNLLHFGAKISHLRANYLEHFGTRITNLDGVCNILNLGSLVGRKCAASWNQFLHNDNIWSISKTIGSRKGHPQIWEGHTFVQ